MGNSAMHDRAYDYNYMSAELAQSQNVIAIIRSLKCCITQLCNSFLTEKVQQNEKKMRAINVNLYWQQKSSRKECDRIVIVIIVVA